MKVIKIFTKSQLILLRNINPLLGRYRLPRSILKRMDYILEGNVLGEQGFMVVILTPVRDDVREIEDAVDIYPLKIRFTDELIYEKKHSADYTTAKGKEWFIEKLSVQGMDSCIYVLYYMLQKHLHKNS